MHLILLGSIFTARGCLKKGGFSSIPIGGPLQIYRYGPPPSFTFSYPITYAPRITSQVPDPLETCIPGVGLGLICRGA